MAARLFFPTAFAAILLLAACRQPAPEALTPTPLPAATATAPALETPIRSNPTPAGVTPAAPVVQPIVRSSEPLLNEAEFRLLTQEDAYNVNHPRDDKANGMDEAGDALGVALVAADFNGDGFDDLAAGAPGEAPASGQPAGAVFLWQGSGGGPSLGRYAPMLPPGDSEGQPGDRFGASLGAGDINKDGFADLVVGAPGRVTDQAPQAGGVYMFEGSPWRPQKGRALDRDPDAPAAAAGDAFGAALATGDLDADGFADVLVGAPGADAAGSADAGALFVYRGTPNWLDAGDYVDQQALGWASAAGDRFGSALAIGDFNDNGRPDVAIGAPGQDSGAGVVLIVEDFSGTPNRSYTLTTAEAGGSPAPEGSFGATLAAGDFNGDGRTDLAVAAPGEAVSETGATGAVYLFGGSQQGLVALSRWTASAWTDEPAPNGRFGQALTVGDLNDDGMADLMVGAPGTTADNGGAVYLLAGSAEGLVGGPRLAASDVMDGDAVDASFGSTLTAGNLRGIGASDLVIGAPEISAGDQEGAGGLVFAGGMPVVSRLTHGALVGAVTDTSVRIWARADQDARLGIKYKPVGGADWMTSQAMPVTSETDFSGVVTLAGLDPDTAYEYVVTLNDIDQAERGGGFRTLPPVGQPALYRFAMGADIYYPDQPFTIFDRVAESQPLFMLLLGDQIYADGPDLAADTRAAYDRKYKENWADRPFSNFARRFPLFMILDDHEIDNDWDSGQTGRYTNGRLAYEAYQNSHNPDSLAPGELYYQMTVGDTEFFVLDARSHRSQNGAPDGPDKTMLGDRQKTALKDWLTNSRAPFKFIVSSIPFNEHGNTGSVEEGQDNWNNFQDERAEIFSLIREYCIPGVVLLTGDQHWAGAFRLPYAEPVRLYEFMPNPLAVPLRPLPEANTPDILFKNNQTLAYGLFDVDTTSKPPRLHHEIRDAQNQVIYQIDLTGDDILPPGACTPE